MKIKFISFTNRGARLAERLAEALRPDDETSCFIKSGRGSEGNAVRVTESLGEWTEKAFRDSDALVFIGACGIAVRAIAPFVRDKRTDPAVVVLDETGAFSVSLLSGHIGGANELAQVLAELSGAQPVITTATDRNRLFSVDAYAAEHGYAMLPFSFAKEISAELTDEKAVGFFSLFPVYGTLPDGLYDPEAGPVRTGKQSGEYGICVSYSTRFTLFPKTLFLVPRCISIGIGCRKGVPLQAAADAVETLLERECIPKEAAACIASVDLKKDETALRELAGRLEIPFYTYSAEQLMGLPGDFTSSDFVLKTTGADNVCERAAVLAAGEGGRLLVKKYAKNGVTAALALMAAAVDFS